MKTPEEIAADCMAHCSQSDDYEDRVRQSIATAIQAEREEAKLPRVEEVQSVYQLSHSAMRFQERIIALENALRPMARAWNHMQSIKPGICERRSLIDWSECRIAFELLNQKS